MKYQILVSDHPKSLSEIVEKHLNDGWQLVGAPFTIARGHTADYPGYTQVAQAMIKKAPRPIGHYATQLK